jgi:hypothetical protein
MKEIIRSVENEKTKNLAVSEKYCDIDDSFFQPKIDLNRLIERSYKILFWVVLNMVLEYII